MNHAGRLFLVYFLPFICALFATDATAVDWEISPRLSGGAQYYEFEQENRVVAGIGPLGRETLTIEDFKLEDTLPMVKGGVAFFIDRFFIDLSAKGAFSGKDELRQETPGFFGEERETTIGEVEAEWDRYELSFATGYAITKNIGFFIGYNRAQTDFDVHAKQTNVGIESPLRVNTDEQTYTAEFVEDGPFIGGTLDYSIGRAGTVEIDAAIAFLEGTIEQRGQGTEIRRNSAGEIIRNNPYVIDDRDKGDSVGVKIALSWRGQIQAVEGLSYSIGAEYYRYDFEAGGGDDFTETAADFLVGIGYVF